MLIECSHCGSRGHVTLPENGGYGLLACPECGESPSMIDVSGWREFVVEAADRKQRAQSRGLIRTRKQGTIHSDRQINIDGLAAELAGCLLLSPGSLAQYMRIAMAGGNNRGRDLVPAITGLLRPVEVKQTRYNDDRRGFLLVRPPLGSGKKMFPHLLDDSYYVLLCGQEYRFRAAGWMDVVGLRAYGQLNPVPVSEGQCECWGIHWSKLWPLRLLANRFRSGLEQAKQAAAAD